MKKTFTFLFVVLLMSACGSTTKKLQQGNYDAVVNKSVKKLQMLQRWTGPIAWPMSGTRNGSSF